MCPERCLRITGRTARVTFIGPMRLARQLPLDLLRRQLLEVARVKAGGIVDQHVDAAEPVDSGPHRRLGIGAARDVQLDGQQVVRLSQALDTRSVSRPEATTAWPAARAALAKSTPMPRLAPVMNQTFLLFIISPFCATCSPSRRGRSGAIYAMLDSIRDLRSAVAAHTRAVPSTARTAPDTARFAAAPRPLARSRHPSPAVAATCFALSSSPQ